MSFASSEWRERIVYARNVGGVTPPDWLVESYEIFRERLTHPDYPCYFGAYAENNADLYYSFVDTDVPEHLPVTLATFIEISSRMAGRRNNLAVFFKQESEPVSHEQRKARAWETLSYLHHHDSEPWPETTPMEPADPLWEFCFQGMLFFIVGLSSTYLRRKSRNMGPGMILLFQPRDVFVNPETGENLGAEARDRIRARLQHWDDVDVHPDLGTYSDPRKNEWKQYFLSDDMSQETGKCPFLANERKRKVAGWS